MKKIIITIIVLLVVGILCVISLGALALTSLDKNIKIGVESMGPEITGTPVTVESIDISPLSGIAQVKGFMVGNPEGYKTESAVKIGRILVSIDLKSLISEAPRVKDFVVEDTQLTWEGSIKGSNIAKIQRNVENFVGTSEDEEESSEEQKIIIDHFIIKNTKLLVSTSMLQGKGQTISITDIELNDIGKEEGGATAKDIVAKVTPILFREIGKVAATIGAGTAIGGPVGGALAVPVTEGVKNVGDKAKDIGKNVTDSIKNIFKR